VVIQLRGDLDGSACELVLRAVTAALKAGTDRVQVDLTAVSSFTDEGAVALTACRRLAPRLRRGLSFSVRGGTGAKALLASLRQDG
jgi:anti-anti-sigma regulatory factor